jgi:CBS domain-containing protein
MRSLRVSAIITPDPVVVNRDATVDEVVAEMYRRQIAQLPVVCAGNVIGMISRVELIAALERSLGRREA